MEFENKNENIEVDNKKRNNKMFYTVDILFLIVITGLYIGVENFNEGLFYMLLGLGLITPIVYFLFAKNSENISGKIDNPLLITDEPRIVENKVVPKEVQEYAKKIALLEGFAFKEFKNYYTLSFGERVKRSVAVIYMVDEFGGFNGSGDTWTFLISLSEPENYTLLRHEADFKTRQLYAESLAHVTRKPQEVREVVREYNGYNPQENFNQRDDRRYHDREQDSQYHDKEQDSRYKDDRRERK